MLDNPQLLEQVVIMRYVLNAEVKHKAREGREQKTGESEVNESKRMRQMQEEEDS